MIPLTPVSPTSTIRIRLDAAKMDGLLMLDDDVKCFSKAFPSGGYFNVDLTTMSNGNTELRLADEQAYPDTKMNRDAGEMVDIYLKLAARFL